MPWCPSVRSAVTLMPLCLRGSALTLAASVVLCSGAGASAGSRAQATETQLCLTVQKLEGMRAANFSPVRGAVDGPPSDDGFQFYDARFNLTGADICKVWFDQQDRGWGYECSWHIADSASGERQFAMLTEAVTSCYPQAKTERPSARRFSIDSPHIKIRFRDVGRLSGLVLTIE
jgi:hypothetical protein